MSERLIQVTIQDEKRMVPYGTTFAQLAGEYQKQFEDRILLAKEDETLRELHHEVTKDAKITFLTIKSPVGYRAFLRSLTLLLMKAVSDVSGRKVFVNFTMGNRFYCTMADQEPVTGAFLQKVQRRMEELAAADLPIIKKNIPTDEAITLFRERGMRDKVQLFRYRLSSRTNVYELDGYVDYYYGFMVPDTSCLYDFELEQYDNGFFVKYPSQADSDFNRKISQNSKLFQIQKQSKEWGSRIGLRDVGDLNDMIVRKGIKEVILLQEAWHEKQIAQIAQTIAGDPAKKFVMIAGPSSSGKTTFSHRLSTQLSVLGLRPHPIALDDYFVNREQTPRDENGEYDFECLEAIDIAQFNEDMTRLLNGERVELPTFNFRTGSREYKGNFLQLGEGDILVLEGIHGLNDKLSWSLPKESKFRIYISALTQLSVDEHNRIATTDGRLIRRMIRDARTRGTKAEGTIAMWQSVRRGEEKHIFPSQESADIMFNSALIYELAVLKVYAQPLLYGISPSSPVYTEAKRLLKFLDYFVPVPSDDIPSTSLIREFIGGSCYET